MRGAEGLQLEGAIGDDKTRLPPRGPTPHMIATCYVTLNDKGIGLNVKRIGLMAESWQIDEATFRTLYVCPDGTPPGRIEGALRPGP